MTIRHPLSTPNADQNRDREADDTIATLARRVGTQGVDVYTLSSDHDLLQLLQWPGIHVMQYEMTLGKPWLVERDDDFVQARFGVTPAQLPEYQALVGGKNGVPGVKGIGKKRAPELLAQAGTIERIDPELLHGEMTWACQAKALHTLRTDAPIAAIPHTTCRTPRTPS